MLQDKAVLPGTLALLKQLVSMDKLAGSSRVGGTALALKYGHRYSEDLDLFKNTEFDRNEVFEVVQNTFGSAFVHQETGFKKSLFCSIQQVKVDVIY